MKIKYDLGLVLVTFIWGTTFVIAKDLLLHTPPINYLTARFILAALLLVIVSRQQLRDRVAMRGGAILGVLLYVGFFTQAIGLLYTTPAKTAFVTGVSVILVPFLGYLLTQERLTLEHILAVILASGGFILLTLPNSNEPFNRGDLICLGGTLFWALHIVATGHWAKEARSQGLLVWQIIVAMICFIISLIVLRSLGVLPTIANDVWPFSFKIGLQLLYLSSVATLGTIVLQTSVQRHISATRAAIIFSLEPAFTAIISYFVNGEQFGWRAISGGLLITVAIVISAIKIFPEKMVTSVGS